MEGLILQPDADTSADSDDDIPLANMVNEDAVSVHEVETTTFTRVLQVI